MRHTLCTRLLTAGGSRVGARESDSLARGTLGTLQWARTRQTAAYMSAQGVQTFLLVYYAEAAYVR